MAKQVPNMKLGKEASTYHILNTIRAQDGNLDYQTRVGEVFNDDDLRSVGATILGNPVLSNQFVSALLNRIALVRLNSMSFYNQYKRFKKGSFDYGMTVEDIFVEIANVTAFDPETAPVRELKTTKPEVYSAFYVINWDVQYPITITDDQLRPAFTDAGSMSDFIESAISSVYRGAEYDDFLLVKYLLIKAVSHGKMRPVSVGDGSDWAKASGTFRGVSNQLLFPRTDSNEAGVLNTTPRERQCIFMDALYNGNYDVNVLASAFHMDKATFEGSLFLIDDFTTFDNERWAEIRSHSDSLEEVTAAELALMKGVVALSIDENWFQIYDNLRIMTEKQIASGRRWNYWYNVKMTVAHSPFANSVVFCLDSANKDLPASMTFTVSGKTATEKFTTLTLRANDPDTLSLTGGNFKFVQIAAATEANVQINGNGTIIIPKAANATDLTLELTVNGTKYTAAAAVNGTSEVGATVTFNKG